MRGGGERWAELERTGGDTYMSTNDLKQTTGVETLHGYTCPKCEKFVEASCQAVAHSAHVFADDCYGLSPRDGEINATKIPVLPTPKEFDICFGLERFSSGS